MNALLRSSTPDTWFAKASADLEALLSDHLHCERKAAENALSLVRRYAGRAEFVTPLMRLAHEETSHVVQVSLLLGARGLRLRPDTPNYFTRALLALVRTKEPDRRVDLLLVAALIEARSHDRLLALGTGFLAARDQQLGDFYQALASAEDRHAELYVDLARQAAPPFEVSARLGELAEREAAIVAALPAASRVH